jgi:hypothetical protein
MVLPPGQKKGPEAITPLYICSTALSGCRLLLKSTNETARALNLLARQSTKMHNASYQNHLALDYLLASEGRIYEKLNLNNCFLQINNKKQKSHKKITDKMRKFAHVPVQT